MSKDKEGSQPRYDWYFLIRFVFVLTAAGFLVLIVA